MTTRLTCLAAVVLVAGLSAASGQRVGTGAVTAAGPVADFRDVAASAGLTARTVIGGEHTKEYILETTGGGTGSDVTAKAGLGGEGWGQGVCAGDYDNDGHIDLFVTYYGQQVLYRNNGDGTFADVTRASGLSLPKPRWNTGCAFLDFNRDGRLDLFVSAYVDYADAMRFAPGSRDNCFWKGLGVMCGPHGLAGSFNALYRANADGTFTDVSERAGLLKARPAFGLTPLVLDA